MKQSMDTPKNCRECPHGRTCKAAYYGGCRCKHEKDIIETLRRKTP